MLVVACHWKKRSKQDPQQWTALEALALSYVIQNRPGRGLNGQLSGATRPCRPGSAPAQQFLGVWLARSGDPSGARLALQVAKSLDQDSGVADLELAKLDVGEGKFESARNIVKAFLEKHSQNVSALMLAAEVEERSGQSTSAIQYYDRVLREDPGNVLALNDLSFTLADSGRDRDRLELAQKAKELAPDSSAVDDTIGWAYYNKGLYQNALEYLEKAASGC